LEDQHITRRDDNINPPWRVHTFPFNTLPPLQSHLQPKFVIFDAGRKLKDKPDLLIKTLAKDYPSIFQIENLYNAWTRKLPAEAARDESYIVSGEVSNDRYNYYSHDDHYDDHDNDIDDLEDNDYVDRRSLSGRKSLSGRTQPGRFGWVRPPPKEIAASVPQKRKASKSAKSHPMSTRKVLSEVTSNTHNQPFLSEVTLYSHNQQIGEAAWTDDRIREWSKKRKLVQSRRKL
jgi:hypothetical protein